MLFWLFSITATYSQDINVSTFNDIISKEYPQTKAGRTLNIAKSLLDKPYVAGTLDQNAKESLVINLQEFDCSTFVENCLALALTKDKAFNTFKNNLQKLRYRNGVIENYSSRLHYFSEWLLQNTKKGIIKDVGLLCGGKPYVKTIDFMTTHQQKYPALENYRVLEAVRMAEIQLSKNKFSHIPKADLKKLEKNIKDGDIISITTSIKGLDVSHEGFAIFVNGRLHLLHASSELKKVVISDIPLAEYLAKHSSQTGIMVASIVD